MNYYNVFFYGNNEPRVVFGHSMDSVNDEFTEMFGADSIDRVEPVSIHQKEKEVSKRGAKVSVLTGYNPFAGRLSEAEDKQEKPKKDDNKTININVSGDASDDDKEEQDAKEVEQDANVKIDKDSPDANGDGTVDAKDDLNKDGKVDAKDLKIAELEKDLRIKELEKGIEEMDDPAPEEKMKKASRLRIKDAGDRFDCLDEKGNCVKKFPYDNKETFAKAARYDAQRFAEKHYAKQLGEETITEGENKQVDGGDPCWPGFEMVGMKDKNGKQVPNCVPVKEETGLQERRKFIFAAMQAKKEGKKKFLFQGKEYPVTIKEDVLEEGVDRKVIKMLKTLDTEEAMMIINGMSKRDQKAYRKALGIKEMVDGRTKAYKETAQRLMAKRKVEENLKKGDDNLIDKFVKKYGGHIPDEYKDTLERIIDAVHDAVDDINEEYIAVEFITEALKRKDKSLLKQLYREYKDNFLIKKKYRKLLGRIVNQFTDLEIDEARDTHCSDKCCGSDVKREDCGCPPDCPHCNCNAENVQEAGYNDLPKTKAEADKKYPDVETDVKNKDSIELQKVSVAETYANYISTTIKK